MNPFWSFFCALCNRENRNIPFPSIGPWRVGRRLLRRWLLKSLLPQHPNSMFTSRIMSKRYWDWRLKEIDKRAMHKARVVWYFEHQQMSVCSWGWKCCQILFPKFTDCSGCTVTLGALGLFYQISIKCWGWKKGVIFWHLNENSSWIIPLVKVAFFLSFLYAHIYVYERVVIN